ncbi:hypothetical protein BGZ58_009314 [Dissophora ornata]|nr:hypothetical protein BGZ58_009314 [Dissophora ornata]
MYKLPDGERYYLELMKKSLPADILNFMTLFLVHGHNGTILKDSIEEFRSALSLAEGPDYDTKVQGRKPADEEISRDNNELDHKRSQPSKMKKSCNNDKLKLHWITSLKATVEKLWHSTF